MSFFETVERGCSGEVGSFHVLFLLVSGVGDGCIGAEAYSFLAGSGIYILGHGLHLWVGELFGNGLLLDLVIL